MSDEEHNEVTAENLTDEQIRELRDVGAAVCAVRARRAAQTRAERVRSAAREKAFNFFGSTDVEQAARSNALSRADAAYGDAVRSAERRFRARIAAAINARRGAKELK